MRPRVTIKRASASPKTAESAPPETAESPRKKGRPRKEESSGDDSSRDRLLAAAIKLFAERGFEGVSTGQVAIAAGLTQSMVHYHFHSKSRLWKAAIEKIMLSRGDLVASTPTDLRDLDPLSRLKVLIRRFIMINAAYPDLARIAVQEGMIRSPRLRWLVSKYVGTTYRRFDAVIGEAMEKGRIRKLPIYEVTNTILISAAIPFTLQAWMIEIYKVRMTNPADIQVYGDVLMSILFEGLQPR